MPDAPRFDPALLPDDPGDPPRTSAYALALAGVGLVAILAGIVIWRAVRTPSAPGHPSETAANEPPAETAQVTPRPRPSTPRAQPAPLEVHAPLLVRFESEPEGASLFLNGKLAGATPLEVQRLTAGVYGVRFERQGCAAKCLCLEVARAPLVVHERLAPVERGTLQVDLEPRGAEVVVDGKVVGLTPLKLDDLATGPHELVVRKTNYVPFSARFVLAPGQTLRYGDLALTDRILELLRGLSAVEPQRVSHCLDLGHYLFTQNRMEEAAEQYSKAMRVAKEPLTFPEDARPEDKELDVRMRAADRTRLSRELQKHRSAGAWPGKDVKLFLDHLVEAQSKTVNLKLDTWADVEEAAQDLTDIGQYAKARELYTTFLTRFPKDPQARAAALAALRLSLTLHDFAGVEDLYKHANMLSRAQPAALLALSQVLTSGRTALAAADQPQVLAWAETTCREALVLAKEKELIGGIAAELARTLTARKLDEAAISYYQLARANATGDAARDERGLLLAEALVRAKRTTEAQVEYNRLLASKVPTVYERAKAALAQLKP